jgi:DNA repair photolyase
MMRRRIKSISSMIEKKDSSYEIIKESRAFVETNKGFKCEEGSGNYPSPRISSEFMDCSLPMTFDQYSSCSLGCLYCFAYYFKSVNPAFRTTLHSVPQDKISDMIRRKPTSKRERIFYQHFAKKRFILHWGGLADPFCNFEKINKRGYEILEALADEKYPTLFSFKGQTVFDKNYVRLFEAAAKQNNFAFQISMVTADDELAKVVEIGVPSPSRRIEAIRMLSDMGYYTILRLRPFIIGVSDLSLDILLEQALKAGISGVSMEFFAMDSRSSQGMRTRYEWLAKVMGVDNLNQYFKNLSPSERGGYMRLNRLIKEEFVKKVYLFCLENKLTFGCSDPDFKELNTSGSCCALPEKYKNPELTNWSKDQLTYHIKEARKLYHKTGEKKIIRFSEVFTKSQSFLWDESRFFISDHVSCTNMTNAERYNLTYRLIAQKHWNNLKSPSNPYNYFHGKLAPIGVDEEGNLKYIYVPMEYEERWKAEKINLVY